MSDYLPLTALVAFMAASCWLGIQANRAMKGESFLKSYFLGGRGLGPWAMALTATVQSGGTFMGYPSLVYTYGWVGALWIASYMVVPLCSFGVFGKRIGQLARQTGAITLPDLLSARFGTMTLGRVASLILIVFFSVNMISQFKGGALILKTVMEGSTAINLAEDNITVGSVDRLYLLALTIFTLVVVGYTVYGGFLAAVWTDVFQSIMMFVGVGVMMPLALMKVGGLEHATRAAVQHTGDDYAFGPGFGGDFLPLGGAVSFFWLWAMASVGSPATMVRHMAFRDTKTLRNAMWMLAYYNWFIYLPLIVICICARAHMPELAALKRSDEVIPRMAVAVAHPVVAGLILTAPFGAVMATVSSFLVVISSGLVRDVYQRWFGGEASEKSLARVSHLSIVVVAALVAIAAVKPPEFMQMLIVYTGGSLSTAFLFPAAMMCFWPRANAPGCLAALLAGPGTMFLLYAVNLFTAERSFKAYPLFGIDPFVWGLVVSGMIGGLVTFATPPMKREHVGQFFAMNES